MTFFLKKMNFPFGLIALVVPYVSNCAILVPMFQLYQLDPSY